MVLLACLAATPSAAAPPRPHVYLVIVDGLDARFVKPDLMPRLFALVERERERTSFFPAAVAVMPARTNPDHVSLLTGVPPAVHGITGNAYWSRVPGAPAAKLDEPALIEVETLFTVIEMTEPERVTFGAFGKPKLARLFAAVPGRQRAPDRVWSALDLPPQRRDPASGYASDADTIAATLAAAETEPDLAVLNLSDVDRAGHGSGPDTPEYRSAIGAADAALARLVDDLRTRGRWDRSVLIVTADHGMTAIPEPPITLAAALGRDVTVAADGGVEHVYANGPPGEALVHAAHVAAATRGVSEVLARVPVEGVTALATAHPDWRLDHQRAGDLLLVAAPGYQFVDPPDAGGTPLRGNHGAPSEQHVPLVVTGGWAGLRSAPRTAEGPMIVDVAPTIVALLGIRRPRRVDGSEIPAADFGRPLDVLTPQSPH